MVAPVGGLEVPAPVLLAFPPPPPPQLAAHRAIKRIVVIRANAAVNIEVPIFTALLQLLSHNRRLLATIAMLPNRVLSNQSFNVMSKPAAA
jgi:hypothetical protein